MKVDFGEVHRRKQNDEWGIGLKLFFARLTRFRLFNINVTVNILKFFDCTILGWNRLRIKFYFPIFFFKKFFDLFFDITCSNCRVKSRFK